MKWISFLLVTPTSPFPSRFANWLISFPSGFSVAFSTPFRHSLCCQLLSENSHAANLKFFVFINGLSFPGEFCIRFCQFSRRKGFPMLIFRIGLLSRECRTPFVLSGEKQKDLYLADQNILQIALNITVFNFHSLNSRTWWDTQRGFVLVMIVFDIRNFQTSCDVLFSLKLFVQGFLCFFLLVLWRLTVSISLLLTPINWYGVPSLFSTFLLLRRLWRWAPQPPILLHLIVLSNLVFVRRLAFVVGCLATVSVHPHPFPLAHLRPSPFSIDRLS